MDDRKRISFRMTPQLMEKLEKYMADTCVYNMNSAISYIVADYLNNYDKKKED